MRTERARAAEHRAEMREVSEKLGNRGVATMAAMIVLRERVALPGPHYELPTAELPEATNESNLQPVLPDERWEHCTPSIPDSVKNNARKVERYHSDQEYRAKVLARNRAAYRLRRDKAI